MEILRHRRLGMKKIPKRGEVYWVKLDPTTGSEIAKTRPALVISNNAGNEASRRIIVAPITSNCAKIFPFEVFIVVKDKEGKILLDQIRTVDKVRLGAKISSCQKDIMDAVDEALKIVLALD